MVNKGSTHWGQSELIVELLAEKIGDRESVKHVLDKAQGKHRDKICKKQRPLLGLGNKGKEGWGWSEPWGSGEVSQSWHQTSEEGVPSATDTSTAQGRGSGAGSDKAASEWGTKRRRLEPASPSGMRGLSASNWCYQEQEADRKENVAISWLLPCSFLLVPPIGRLEYRATWQRTMGLAVLQPQHHCVESKGLSFGAEKQCLKDWYIGWIIIYGCR